MSMLSRILLSKSALTQRILIPANIMSMIALSILGYMMMRFNVDSVKSAMDSKVEFAVNFLQHSGASYLANYDLTALEGFVKETEKDPDVVYTVFIDPAGKPLTKGSKEKPKDETGVLSVERELKDTEGKPLGTVKVAYSTARMQQAVKTAIYIAIISVLFVQLVLTGTLLAIVRSINASMKMIMDRLSDASNTIAATSDELSSSSDNLSKGVTKQAAAVQETVASMAEMSSMLAQTAGNARSVYTLTGKVSDKSKMGTSTMEKLVAAMTSIESANAQLHNMVAIIKDISNKTNVINDIVFKTQLLSLNASIEAARAGQHGRGFAVVAEEVGNLAQMSGSAAKEISALLESSMRDVSQIVRNTEDRVKDGREVSDEALKAFNEIANDIDAISLQIQSINEAAKEQEQGVKQSSNAMVMVDETTHANSNIAKQAHSSSLLLAEQSKRITQITRAIRQLILGAAEDRRSIARKASSNEFDSVAAERIPMGNAPEVGDAASLAERIVQKVDDVEVDSLPLAKDSEVDASDSSFQRKG